ncbi:pilin [Candidatus Saccharibacteria bacterium]|jgi:hypothetical protein|nr:pilin [Candidatus Saccharibacteria bacterium]
MLQKLKTLLLSISLLFSFSAPVLAAAPAFAVGTDIGGSLCKGSNLNLDNPDVAGGTCTTDKTSFTDIIRKVINILSVLVGAIAVIMIIIGGFRYVTSGGNDSSVAAARKTIMYALIGLLIVAFAQVVVHFILNNITT